MLSCSLSMRGLFIAGCFLAMASQANAQLCDAVETQKIVTSGGGPIDNFGGAVAALGDRVVIGAAFREHNGLRDGAVYTYEYINSNWTMRSLLYPTVLNPIQIGNGEEFGRDLDLDADLLVVGATGTDQMVPPFYVDAGSIYIYRHNGLIWTDQVNIMASIDDPGDNYGSAVAVSGDTILVGAPTYDAPAGFNNGLVYVYRYNGTTWSETARLQSPTIEDNAEFGSSVDIDGNVFVIGAGNSSNPGFIYSGEAYVYRSVGGVIALEATLSASDAVNNQNFGASVAISGNKIVIGAPGDPQSPTGDEGAAYLFTRSGGQWNQVAKMRDTHGFPNDRFGSEVAIEGSSVVVGAQSNDENGIDSGLIYSYTIDAGTLSSANIIRASDGTDNDSFGSSVTISGEHIIVGASGSDTIANNAGAAYALSMACPTCPADLNGDGFTDFLDISAFLTAFAANDPTVDFNEDGFIDFLDISIFLTSFSAGCP